MLPGGCRHLADLVDALLFAQLGLGLRGHLLARRLAIDFGRGGGGFGRRRSIRRDRRRRRGRRRNRTLGGCRRHDHDWNRRRGGRRRGKGCRRHRPRRCCGGRDDGGRTPRRHGRRGPRHPPRAGGAAAESTGVGAATAAVGAAAGAFDEVGAPGVNAAGGGAIDFFSSMGDMNGSPNFGSALVTPTEPSRRICGVIMTTSSVRFFWAALLRNRYPRIGMSPMPGIFCSVSFMVLFSSPAIANVCPSRSSSSVAVRRVVRAGTRKPFITTALEKSSELTSGATFRCTRSPSTCGVKASRIPNSLNWTLIVVLEPEPCATGIGNSPPARNVASLPLSATRFGSARLWNRPFVDSARIRTPRSYFSLRTNRFRKSLNVTLPDEAVTSLPNDRSPLAQLRSVKSAPGNCCVDTRPRVLLMPVGLVNSEIPSSVRAWRLTSANRTRSRTWLVRAMPTCSRLTTSSRFSTNPALRPTSLSATSLLDTVPASTTFLPLVRTSTFSPGNSCCTCSVNFAMSRDTMSS